MTNPAIAELRKMQEEYQGIDGIYHEVYDALDDAISRIEALGDGWVKCSERLPRDSEWVLTWHPASGYMVGYSNGGGLFDDGDFNDHILKSHWMPLPESPLPPPPKL